MGIAIDNWNSPDFEINKLQCELSEKNIYITQLENKVSQETRP